MLNHRLEAYQNQLFDGDNNYIGFQCPNGNPDCPIKKGDGLEVMEAYSKISGTMEFAHDEAQRFSATRTSYPQQGEILCMDCHGQEHLNDPSASRVKRTKK